MSYTQIPNATNPNDIDYSITSKASTIPYIGTWDWQCLRFFRVPLKSTGPLWHTSTTQKQVALESFYIDTPPHLPTVVFDVASLWENWWLAMEQHWQEWETVDTAAEAFSASFDDPRSVTFCVRAPAWEEVRIDITTN